jgi:hypothetical protein
MGEQDMRYWPTLNLGQCLLVASEDLASPAGKLIAADRLVDAKPHRLDTCVAQQRDQASRRDAMVSSRNADHQADPFSLDRGGPANLWLRISQASTSILDCAEADEEEIRLAHHFLDVLTSLQVRLPSRFLDSGTPTWTEFVELSVTGAAFASGYERLPARVPHGFGS